MKALTFFILITLSACTAETHFLIEPLEWLTAEMEKNQITQHLPSKEATFINKRYYIRLSAIQESTYQETGIDEIHLFFKKKGSKKIINAVQLVFKNTSTNKTKLLHKLNKLYTITSKNRWRTKNSFVVDIAYSTSYIKITYDARQ